jgi:hypothetical protein
LLQQRLDSILAEAGIDQQDREKVVDFLLYYGVLGTRLGDNDHFIYSVNYDLKVLKIRAQRLQGTAGLRRQSRFLAGARHKSRRPGT